MKITRCVAGATLVETMASVLLFALMVGAILDVGMQNMTAGRRSEAAYYAYSLTKNHIETLKSMPFSDISSAAESNTLINATGVPDILGLFKRTTTVTTSYSGDADLIQVVVSVDYKIKGKFVNHPITLTTCIFQYA